MHHPALKIMYECRTLRIVVNAIGRCEDIVVHQAGAVRHLNHPVTVILIIQVSAHPGSLSLPVKPGSKGAVMDTVVYDLNVNGGVQLDACDFITEEFVLHRDIVDMVIVDPAEYTAHMPNNAVLPAVVDFIAADDMGTHKLPAPSSLQPLAYRFPLILISGLILYPGALVLSRCLVLADADGAAFLHHGSDCFQSPSRGSS